LDIKYGPLGRIVRLTNPLIQGLKPRDKDYHLSDSEIRALKLKVTPSGHKSFILRFRTSEGRERKFKIGVFPDTPTALARDIAKKRLAEVVQGEDPSARRSVLRADAKFQDFADRFISNHAEVYLRPKTIQDYRSVLKNHINPAIGQSSLQSIAKQDIRDLHQSLSETPYQANRVIDLIREIFNKAIEWELIPPSQNPAAGLKKYPEHTRDTLLSIDDMHKVAEAIQYFREVKPAVQASLDAITLLFLTGLRLNEALQLKWDDIDFERRVIVLRKTKTKPRPYPMVASQEEFLRELHSRSLSEYLFPHPSYTEHLKGVKKPWDWIRERAGIKGFRIHDIRHTIGSNMGTHADITTIASVLGHADRRTTERYVHAQSENVRKHLSQATDATATIFATAGKERGIIG
jgi:integrase